MTRPRVIQFPHPGFECSRSGRFRYRQAVTRSNTLHEAHPRDEIGVMGWKPEGSIHDRKYLTATGSVLAAVGTPLAQHVQLGFWTAACL
jgi:hypothetical protein